MRITTQEIKFTTKGEPDVIDLSDMVLEKLKKTNIKSGMLTLFVSGSTGAVSTIEYEPGLKEDIVSLYNKLIPKMSKYNHDATWGDGNGYAHLRATLQGASITVPIVDSRLTLGTWQQLVFLEFDNRPRNRNIILQFIGEE